MVVDAETVTITEKPHKPYPSAAERIAMADQQIEHLTALRSSREALVAKTEAIRAERQKALVFCATSLEKALSRKVCLFAVQRKPPKVSLHSKSHGFKSLVICFPLR